MRGHVDIEPGYEDLLSFSDSTRRFESISEFFGFPLGRDQRRRSKVARKELLDKKGHPVGVYFKLYGYRRLKRALSRIFKPTRSKSEITNLKLFHELGIPACTPILQGEYKNVLGIARNCMIITLEIPQAIQLNNFLDNLNSSNESETTRTSIKRQIMESLATNIRKIHDYQFYHDDLKWRNVLIQRLDPTSEKVHLFWIDCPNGYRDRTGVRSKHGEIKDLATMDYDAKSRVSKRERLQFLELYSGHPPESTKFRQLLREVVAYRKLKIDD